MTNDEQVGVRISVKGRPDFSADELSFVDIGYVRYLSDGISVSPAHFHCRCRVKAESRDAYNRWFLALCSGERSATVEMTGVEEEGYRLFSGKEFVMVECSDRNRTFILDSVYACAREGEGAPPS